MKNMKNGLTNMNHQFTDLGCLIWNEYEKKVQALFQPFESGKLRLRGLQNRCCQKQVGAHSGREKNSQSVQDALYNRIPVRGRGLDGAVFSSAYPFLCFAWPAR